MIAYVSSSAQTTSLDFCQGTWQEEVDGDFESYIFIENNNWYSIIVIDEKIVVSKDFFGFLDNFDLDSIKATNLLKSGQYLVYLVYRKSIKNYNSYIKRAYCKFFSYDIGSDYLVYYANQPVSLNRIDSLPKNITSVFEEKKKALDEKIIFPSIVK